MTIQEQAQEALACFESARRQDGEVFERIKDGSPPWVTDLVREAHFGHLPHDRTFALCRSALEHIAAAGADEYGDYYEWCNAQVDVYTADRVAWLASAPVANAALCDEAAEEIGTDADASIDDRLALGQYYEAQRVIGSVSQSLEELDELDDTIGG